MDSRLAGLVGGRIALPRAAEGTIRFWPQGGETIGAVSLGGASLLDVAAAGGETYALTRGGPEGPIAEVIDNSTLTIKGQYLATDLGVPSVPDVRWPWSMAASDDGFAIVTAGQRFVVAQFDRQGHMLRRLEGGLRQPWLPGPPKGREAGSPLALGYSADGSILALVATQAGLAEFASNGDSTAVSRTPLDAVDFVFTEAGDLVASTASSDRLMRPGPATLPAIYRSIAARVRCR